jgi:hypothetical protein
VLETLGEIYHNDDLTREQGMSPEQRLGFHQARSGPVMEKLHAWLTAQLEEKKAEPNSGLGQAISYLLNHWRELTLFLRQPRAPLDNNVCERALKKVILHRKNALFYKNRLCTTICKSVHSARVSGNAHFGKVQPPTTTFARK